jgi:tRNA A-37 threonylcarbamoyl transferase component Bud32
MAEQVYLGRYKVTRQLDQGGMSRIYLARDAASGREVVVKVLRPEFLAASKSREHFRREIHIMSRFEHPNAVKYLDAAPNDPGGPVLVMEYLRGVDLGVLLHQRRRLSPERAGRLLGQLCDVLQAAHDGGIIHRDIKPGNLMILHGGTPDETLKLMDFGLAKITAMLYIAPDELINYPEPAAAGTPEYISPEEVRGRGVDARTDLYSVGVVLYEMLAGRLPFAGDDVQKLMRCHEKVTPPTFAEIGLGGAIPSAIEDVVRCCLNKQPDQRPRSATELALRYEKALGKRITQFRRPGATTTNVRVPALRAAAGTPLTATPPPSARAAQRAGMQHSIEAVMPEALALVKLKGFIHDLGGEVIESVPGMIRVRLGGEPAEKKKAGLFGWLGGGAPTAAPAAAEVELHMERRDSAQPNRLTITLVMNPARGLICADLRDRCNRIGRDLQAYLMGR